MIGFDGEHDLNGGRMWRIVAFPGILNTAPPAEQIAFHSLSCRDFEMWHAVALQLLRVFAFCDPRSTFKFGARDPESEREREYHPSCYTVPLSMNPDILR